MGDHLTIEDVVMVVSTLDAALCPAKRTEVGKKTDIPILDTLDYRDLAYRFGGNLVARVFKGGGSISKEVN